MIKVVIERHCLPDKEVDLMKLLLELRSTAMWESGYHSGETLRSVDDPSIWLVIGTWQDMEHWQLWYDSAKRKEISTKINQFLSEPEKISVFSFIR